MRIRTIFFDRPEATLYWLEAISGADYLLCVALGRGLVWGAA